MSATMGDRWGSEAWTSASGIGNTGGASLALDFPRRNLDRHQSPVNMLGDNLLGDTPPENSADSRRKVIHVLPRSLSEKKSLQFDN